MQNITVALDAMGGDFGPRVTVPATLDILRQQPNLRVVLFGDAEQIQQQLRLAADHFPVVVAARMADSTLCRARIYLV